MSAKQKLNKTNLPLPTLKKGGYRQIFFKKNIPFCQPMISIHPSLICKEEVSTPRHVDPSPYNLLLNPMVVPLNPAGTPHEVIGDFWSYEVYEGCEGKLITVDDPEKIPTRNSSKHKFTVVFDMDETLLRVVDDTCFIRPYAKKVLESLRKYPEIELILWSAGVKIHVERCILFLDPKEEIFSHRICRGESWVSKDDEGRFVVFKDLSRLSGRPEETIMIFDDSIMASVMNPNNSVVIPAFDPYISGSENDTTLLYILQIVLRNFILTFQVDPDSKPKGTTNLSLLKKNPFITRIYQCRSDHSYFSLDVHNSERLKWRVERFYKIQAKLMMREWGM